MVYDRHENCLYRTTANIIQGKKERKQDINKMKIKRAHNKHK